MNEITFTKVKLPYGWLGNMSPFPLTFHNLEWKTAEHLFQALRFPYSSPIREEIRMQIGPMQAKFVAQKYKHLMEIEPRSQQDLEAMELVLLLKLEQHPQLREQLLATGEAIIIEDETSRKNRSTLFWGAARTSYGWEGRNELGKLWMKLRLREQVQSLTLP